MTLFGIQLTKTAKLLPILGIVACSQPSENRRAIQHSIVTSADDDCVTLLAGQHIEAGTVCTAIINDANTSADCGAGATGAIEVTYTTINGWTLNELHLAAGDELSDIPANQHGNPRIGHFPYAAENLSTLSYTFTIPLCEFGLDSADTDCEPTAAFYAAHAVVSLETDPGEYQTETAWGEGTTLTQKGSWAMYFDQTLECEEPCIPGFDNDALETELAEIAGDSETVNLTVQSTGSDPSTPYFNAELDYDGDGIPERTDLPTYCIDLANNITPGQQYCSRLYSPYDDILPSDIVHPENMDLVNYLLNTYSIGDLATDGTAFTGGDFQRACWSLIFGTLPSPGAHGSGPSSDYRVNELIAFANANGEGFEPECDGVVAVLLYPVDCYDPNFTIAGQVLIGQMLITEFDASCNICEEEDELPDGCETTFAFGEQCFLNLDEDADGNGDFNRWGWREQVDGTYTADLYAGAGQCDTGNGTLVGTMTATVNYDNTITVDYAMATGYTMSETHLYIGDNLPLSPNGQTTVAPGRYTEGHELQDATTDSYTLPGTIGDYLIAHAVVCGFND